MRLHKDPDKVKIEIGIRQGDTYSPKLFSACLEGIFIMISRESKGINIEGENNNYPFQICRLS